MKTNEDTLRDLKKMLNEWSDSIPSHREHYELTGDKRHLGYAEMLEALIPTVDRFIKEHT